MIITEENYVDYAEQVIKNLRQKKQKNGKPVPSITTSKIRNLLAMAADIHNEVISRKDESLTSEVKGRIEYMRMRFVYESGREPAVKAFVEESKLLDILKSINGNKKNYLLFNKYMEALVAFHRYHGGRD